MKLGTNSGGWPLVSFYRDESRWALDINEGGRGLIFNVKRWHAGWLRSRPTWFVYVAFWFTRKVRGRWSRFW